jgi:HK97 family phage prohead protease
MEIRFQATEVRATGPKQISGRAASYGTRAQLKGFSETIARGAFDRVLRTNPDVVCLFNHDTNCVLGRTTSGTLRLSASNEGLDDVCDLPNTTAARDLRESIQRRDVNGCSFAFNLGEGDDEWSEDMDEDRNRVVLRTIRNFSQLLDVSPVTYPAYGGTELQARCTEISAEMRSRLLTRGIVIPTVADMARIIARRKNLLSQM